jgi:hypothetical protein
LLDDINKKYLKLFGKKIKKGEKNVKKNKIKNFVGENVI